jgi:hypothetical protein
VPSGHRRVLQTPPPPVSMAECMVGRPHEPAPHIRDLDPQFELSSLLSSASSQSSRASFLSTRCVFRTFVYSASELDS